MFDNERAYDTLDGWLLAPLLPKEGLVRQRTDSVF